MQQLQKGERSKMTAVSLYYEGFVGGRHFKSEYSHSNCLILHPKRRRGSHLSSKVKHEQAHPFNLLYEMV